MSNVYGFVPEAFGLRYKNGASAAGYVTIDTAQTITGIKTFDNYLVCTQNISCMNLGVTQQVNALSVQASYVSVSNILSFPDGTQQLTAYKQLPTGNYTNCSLYVNAYGQIQTITSGTSGSAATTVLASQRTASNTYSPLFATRSPDGQKAIYQDYNNLTWDGSMLNTLGLTAGTLFSTTSIGTNGTLNITGLSTLNSVQVNGPLNITKNSNTMTVGVGGGVNSLFTNVNIGTFVMPDTANSITGGNIAIGDGPLSSLTSGDSNVAIGANALAYTTSGSANVAIGPNALINNVTGNYNFALGNRSLELLTSGTNNVGINGGTTFTTGSYNVCLGGEVGNSLTYATAIGSGANCTTSNTIMLGRSADNVSCPNSLTVTSYIDAGSLSITGTSYLNGAANMYGSVTIRETGQLTSLATQPASNNSSTLVPTTAWVQSAITAGSGAASTVAMADNTTSSSTYALCYATAVADGNKSVYQDYTNLKYVPNINKLTVGDLDVYSPGSNLQNVAIGKGAAPNMSTGTNNIFIGQGAGLNNTTNTSNIGIGYQACGASGIVHNGHICIGDSQNPPSGTPSTSFPCTMIGNNGCLFYPNGQWNARTLQIINPRPVSNAYLLNVCLPSLVFIDCTCTGTPTDFTIVLPNMTYTTNSPYKGAHIIFRKMPTVNYNVTISITSANLFVNYNAITTSSTVDFNSTYVYLEMICDGDYWYVLNLV